MKEKDLQVLFGKWCKENWTTPAGFELKICKTPTFNFKKIEQHQIQGLLDCKQRGIFHKISDLDFRLSPFDCFFLKGEAYLALLFYKPRQPKLVYLIGIQELLTEMKKGVKSITEDKAKLIASKIVKI